MGLNLSKGNMYEFVTHTWNPIKGRCPFDCSYCYMKRWGQQKPPRLDTKDLHTDLGSGNFIFVGSSIVMFSPDFPYDWLMRVIGKCYHYDNKYLFQSKNPSYFDIIPILDIQEYFLCITLETNRFYPAIMNHAPEPVVRALDFRNIPIENKLITVEPIMDFDEDSMYRLILDNRPLQVNIGADSGNHNLPEPSFTKIEYLIKKLEDHGIIVHIKKNLKRLYEQKGITER